MRMSVCLKAFSLTAKTNVRCRIQFYLKRLDSKVSVDIKNEYVTLNFILLRMVKTNLLVDGISKM